MLSDSVILKKIGRQPQRTAGYKQLVRELGVARTTVRRVLQRWQRERSGQGSAAKLRPPA